MRYTADSTTEWRRLFRVGWSESEIQATYPDATLATIRYHVRQCRIAATADSTLSETQLASPPGRKPTLDLESRCELRFAYVLGIGPHDLASRFKVSYWSVVNAIRDLTDNIDRVANLTIE